MRFITLALDVAGGVGIVAGCFLVSLPVAFIVAGIFCLAFAFELERNRERNQ
jgi:uncharacterized membrane protein